ncbi:MAG: methionyl-tRNA formyltransferase [Betaproteobacteria bacterium RIFCSPLOWO2_02_67_12]|nr:MAG: methionyl-tRNA formyltransferase [Betaproteobacteria bacterium RIFCSPLOWO2_02_67_12]
MRIVFAGTPEFAARSLAALLASGHDVALALTQPERPAARGLKPVSGAVQRLAEQRGIPTYRPASLKPPEVQERIAAAHPEVFVVAAYGLILPQALLDIAARGALNIHASLLPRWRGAAPIQRAILAGDRETGITIMQMDDGLDTGPILLQHALAVTADDDSQTLHDRLAELGATLIVAALDALARGEARITPQPLKGVSYASKIGKDEALLDWSRPAVELERAIRAFRPAPGARTTLRGLALKIWSARSAAGEGAPGTVLEPGSAALRIACGDGALEVLELQRPGGRRLATREFLRGFAVRVGERFGAAR